MASLHLKGCTRRCACRCWAPGRGSGGRSGARIRPTPCRCWSPSRASSSPPTPTSTSPVRPALVLLGSLGAGKRAHATGLHHDPHPEQAPSSVSQVRLAQPRFTASSSRPTPTATSAVCPALVLPQPHPACDSPILTADVQLTMPGAPVLYAEPHPALVHSGMHTERGASRHVLTANPCLNEPGAPSSGLTRLSACQAACAECWRPSRAVILSHILPAQPGAPCQIQSLILTAEPFFCEPGAPHTGARSCS